MNECRDEADMLTQRLGKYQDLPLTGCKLHPTTRLNQSSEGTATAIFNFVRSSVHAKRTQQMLSFLKDKSRWWLRLFISAGILIRKPADEMTARGCGAAEACFQFPIF